MRRRAAAALVCVLGVVGMPVQPAAAESATTERATSAEVGIPLEQLRSLDLPTNETEASRGNAAPTGDCDQTVVNDPSGDGPIDIRSARLVSDCERWRVSIDLHASIDLRTLDYWAVQIDADLDLRTGCNGTDLLAVARPNPSLPSGFGALVYDTINCAEGTWGWSGVAAGGNGSSMWVDLPEDAFTQTDRSFRWFAAALRIGVDDYDTIPDGVWRLARTIPTDVGPLLIEQSAREARVRWWKPLQTGGARIEGYRVEYKKAGETRWRALARPGSALSATLPRLDVDQKYLVRVAARNAIGRGGWSSGAFRAIGLSSPPTEPWSIRGDGVARLLWSPPLDDGGRPVTAYVVTLRTPDGSTRTVPLAHPLATQVVIDGLDKGGEYTASIAATTEAGISAPVEHRIEDGAARPHGSSSAHHHEAPVAVTPAATPGSPATRIGSLACKQRFVGDTLERSVVDVTSAIVTSGNCQRWSVSVWVDLGLQPAARLREAQVWIDTDLDLRTGCRGADRYVTMTPRGSRVTAAHWTTPTCNRRGWTQLTPTRGKLLPSGFGTEIPGLPRSVRWWLETSGADGAADRVPDRGWVTTVSLSRPPETVTVDEDRNDTTTLRWSPPTDTGGLPIIRYEVTIHSWRGGLSTLVLPSQRSLTIPRSMLTSPTTAYVYAVTARGPSRDARRTWQPRLRPEPPSFQLIMRREGVLVSLPSFSVDSEGWTTLSRTLTLQTGFGEHVPIGYFNVPSFPVLTDLVSGQDYTITLTRRTAQGTSPPMAITFIAP